MNKAFIIGRLTKDVNLTHTKTQTAVGTFTVAVDRPFKDKNGEKQADFIPVVTFGALAENCSNYIGKGRMVGITGRIQVDSWENDQGQRRYKTQIMADEVQFLDRPKEDGFYEIDDIEERPF